MVTYCEKRRREMPNPATANQVISTDGMSDVELRLALTSVIHYQEEGAVRRPIFILKDGTVLEGFVTEVSAHEFTIEEAPESTRIEDFANLKLIEF
jgi:hypothetical protein